MLKASQNYTFFSYSFSFRDLGKTHHELFHHVNGDLHFSEQYLHKPKWIFHLPILTVKSFFLVWFPNHTWKLELCKVEFHHWLCGGCVLVGGTDFSISCGNVINFGVRTHVMWWFVDCNGMKCSRLFNA